MTCKETVLDLKLALDEIPRMTVMDFDDSKHLHLAVLRLELVSQPGGLGFPSVGEPGMVAARAEDKVALILGLVIDPRIGHVDPLEVDDLFGSPNAA
jgi:hypothetical protein